MAKTKEELKAEQRKALIDAGLTEAMADAAMGVFGDVVEYTRFQQVIGERNDARGQVSERDKTITGLQTTLKGAEGATDALKKAQEALAQKDGELAHARKTAAVQLGIAKSKAKNEKAVLALLDDSKITLGDDGTLKGLDEQISALQKSDAYLFGDGAQTPPPGGFNPASGGSPADAFEAQMSAAMGIVPDK